MLGSQDLKQVRGSEVGCKTEYRTGIIFDCSSSGMWNVSLVPYGSKVGPREYVYIFIVSAGHSRNRSSGFV